MGQQVKVERKLQFKGPASHTDNVEGNISYKKVVLEDDFRGKAIDNVYDYTVAAIGAGTATVTVPHCLTLTTAGNTEDDVDFATEICFYGQYNATIEARLRNDDVSASALFFGFSDAQGEAADKIAFYLTSTGTIKPICNDGVGFVMDSDATDAEFLNIIKAVSVMGTATGSILTGPTDAIVDASFRTLRVELRDQDGATGCDALFFVNKKGEAIDPENDYVGTERDAVTRDTALCGYIGYMTRENGANTLDVDYIKIWSDRAGGTST